MAVFQVATQQAEGHLRLQAVARCGRHSPRARCFFRAASGHVVSTQKQKAPAGLKPQGPWFGAKAVERRLGRRCHLVDTLFFVEVDLRIESLFAGVLRTHRFVGFQLHVPVVLHASSSRNEPPHDDVLFQTA